MTSATTTPNLGLTYLAPSQSQPEVPINDAWNKIDAAVAAAGGSIKVGSVSGVTQLNFTEGATVTAGDAGVADVAISGGGSSGGAGSENITPDSHPATADAMDDEFEAGSLDAKWSWFNQLSATATLEYGRLRLATASDGGPPYQTHLIAQPVPTGSWRFRCKQSTIFWPAVNVFWGGLAVYESVGGKIADVHRVYSSGFACEVDLWSALDTSTVATEINFNPFTAYGLSVLEPLYFEIEYDGTNLHFRYSHDGDDACFQTVYSAVAATLMGAVPTHVGLNIGASGSGAANSIVDWFRRMA